MTKSHHNKEIMNIYNSSLQRIYFDQKQLTEYNIDINKMSSTLKLTKKQEQENFSRKKLLKKHITSYLENYDLIYLYIDLKKHLLS